MVIFVMIFFCLGFFEVALHTISACRNLWPWDSSGGSPNEDHHGRTHLGRGGDRVLQRGHVLSIVCSRILGDGALKSQLTCDFLSWCSLVHVHGFPTELWLESKAEVQLTY